MTEFNVGFVIRRKRLAENCRIRALVKMVNALTLVFGEKDYTSFIDYVNTEVTHYKREVIGQKAKAPTTSGGSAADSGSSKPSGGSSSGGQDFSTDMD